MRFLLPVAILAAGVALFVVLLRSRSPPPREEPVHRAPLVETVQAPPATARVVVRGQGTVRPDREIDLVPQVGGRIVWISEQMETGGFYSAGQELARIDPEDFALALDQADAEVARALYQLEIARGEAEVAAEEWERLRAGGGSEPSDLALHIPQVRLAEATLKAARARRREAELRLERTRLRAPFAGRVRSTDLDVGQYVSPGRGVARLYGIERAEVPVPVPDEELAWIDVPSPPVSPRPSPAADSPPPELPQEAGRGQVLLRARHAGRDHTWKGRVARTEGQVDPRSRMINLIVEVDAPYDPRDSATAPLMVGLFVEVEIQGRPLTAVRTIPRRALHDGGVVWLAEDGRLRRQLVEVVHLGREEALVRFDAAPGARVITSQLRGVTDGMAVAPQRAEAP
ncbi:MAG: efflux RND transporter periplasmic adaptor subunit [Gemmatimonadaceae bacterium]|nr:efflux RND transporter periplasmic adaptor subunit [Gemmatimonadaceae bacterium]